MTGLQLWCIMVYYGILKEYYGTMWFGCSLQTEAAVQHSASQGREGKLTHTAPFLPRFEFPSGEAGGVLVPGPGAKMGQKSANFQRRGHNSPQYAIIYHNLL